MSEEPMEAEARLELTGPEWELSLIHIYPGRFGPTANGHDLSASLYPVTSFLGQADAPYGYAPEEALPLPAGATATDDGTFGRYALGWSGDDAGRVLAAGVPAWAAFVADWRGE